ncbi:MAG: hypothetical protein ACFB14_06070 [Leptolyngbyaceae cyanobacterium]
MVNNTRNSNQVSALSIRPLESQTTQNLVETALKKISGGFICIFDELLAPPKLPPKP